MVEELACVQALIFSAAGRVFLCPRKETIWRSGERFTVLDLMLTSQACVAQGLLFLRERGNARAEVLLIRACLQVMEETTNLRTSRIVKKRMICLFTRPAFWTP